MSESYVLQAMAKTARNFKFDKPQRDKLPDYRGPLPDVLSCQNDM